MADVLLRSKLDVIQFVNKHGVTRSSLAIVMIALGGTFVDGYDFASLGIGVPGLIQEFGLTPLAVGSVAAIMGLGAIVGGIVGGYYTDKLGRYHMFLIDLVCLVVATLGAALSPNLYCLLFFRFLMGVGVGLDYPVAFSFIVEYMNSRNKAGSVTLWVVMWQAAVATSVLVALLCYYLGAGIYLWRFAVGFGAVPALLLLILRGRYMSESPMWAAEHLGLREAGKIIEKTYNVTVTVDEAPEAPAATSARKRGFDGSFKDIFEPRYLARTILCSIIGLTVSVQYFAVGFYMPSISQAIFGKEFLFAAFGSLASAAVGAGAGLASSFLVGRWGVVRLSAVGYVIIIAALLTFWATAGAISPYLSILIVYVFILGQAGGPGPQYATIAALSYPTHIRGIGTGWSQAVTRLGTIAGSYFTPILMAAVGINNMMLILAIVPVLALIALMVIRWEPEAEAADLDAAETPLRAELPPAGAPA